MSGVQLLDVGDHVVINRTGWGAQQAVVIADREYLGWEEGAADYALAATGGYVQGVAFIQRHEITRCGGDLQVGDFVRVTGRCEQAHTSDIDELDAETGIIVDDFEAAEHADFLVYVHGECRVYECRARHLTRIRRGEVVG